MRRMRVSLLFASPLWVCAYATRKSKDSHKFSDTNGKDIGEKDFKLIKRVGIELGHSSVLEHIVMSFNIDGISRALLQELVRTRIASYTVKSTRYTLGQLKSEDKFIDDSFIDFERAKKYLVFTDNKNINIKQIKHLEDLREIITDGAPNDVAKYLLPESFKTSLVMTINMRSLQNMCDMRTSHRALKEYRNLCHAIYNSLDDKYRELLSNFMH